MDRVTLLVKGVADLGVALGIALSVYVATRVWVREIGAREKFEVSELPGSEAVEIVQDLTRGGAPLFFV